jgi:Putative prokaryotic signal transducing protein
MTEPTMDEVPEVLLCEVANEVEASLVVNLLNEDEIPARSDATQAMNVFGGLPFEPGHKIFVPASQARKALQILAHYPHFKKLKNVHEPD